MRPAVFLLMVSLTATLLGCAEEGAARTEQPSDDSLPVGLPIAAAPEDDGHSDAADADDEGEGAPSDEVDPPVEEEPTPPGDNEPAPEEVGPEPETQCSVWQECGPLYDDPNSGMECVANTCQCDPVGEWSQTCVSMGGFWIASACQCVFSDEAPPSYEPSEDCWWHLEQPPCDPDRWVDTSHYEDDCYYDAYDQYVCDAVWVESGYYEAGACPSPYWEERCYG